MKKPKAKVSALTKARSALKKADNAYTPSTIKRKLESVKAKKKKTTSK
jgi:hypothetical protein